MTCEDLARRRLALQPGLQLAELADVLDGDDGLSGEALDQVTSSSEKGATSRR